MTARQPSYKCAGCSADIINNAPRRKYCSIACACWSRIDRRGPSECWPWLGCTDSVGYGKFSWGRERELKAHRIAFETVSGSLNGLNVLHKCDNPPCCNPAHLFAGTQADNVKDMDIKGRRVNAPRAGSKHHRAILDEKKVIAIRGARKAGASRAALAAEYGVSVETINAVVYRKQWRHV